MIVGTMKDYKLKLRILHVSDTQVCAGRKHSTPSIGCHGQAGDTRPGQTRKTPKDLRTREREERGRGEGVGLYAVHICGFFVCIFHFFFSRKYSYCSRLRKAVPLPFAKCLPVCGQFGVTIRCRIGVRTRMRRYAMPHSRAVCAKQPLFAFPPAFLPLPPAF